MEKRSKHFATIWGRWSGKRELVRGALHGSVGIIGWTFVHPVQLDSHLITFLLCIVSASFIILEVARLAVNRWRNTDWYARLLQWINNRVVKKFLTRETETHEQTTIIPSVLGLSLAWFMGERWICAAAIFYFGLVDPLAKLGRYWPVHVFQSGRAKGKSLGGLLFGILGGAFGLSVVLIVNSWVRVIPQDISVFSAGLVFVTGLLSASFLELFGGKLDNFLIPAGSVTVMTIVSKIFLI